MSERDIPIDETELMAFADGTLPEARRAALEAWLDAHPDDAATVLGWQQQNEAIRALYPLPTGPTPERLAPHIMARRPSRAQSWPAMAAAAVVVLALGLGGGYFIRDIVRPLPLPSALLIDNAVVAHALYVKENRHAVEVAASDRQHLVTWLSSRIESPIDAPDLVAEGFSLVGGRLLPEGIDTQAGPAAQLMYENAAAERLTVYVTGALPDRASAYQFVQVAGLDAFYWANDQITCTVIGDIPEAQMQVVAKKVFQQLTRRPDAAYRGG